MSVDSKRVSIPVILFKGKHRTGDVITGSLDDAGLMLTAAGYDSGGVVPWTGNAAGTQI